MEARNFGTASSRRRDNPSAGLLTRRYTEVKGEGVKLMFNVIAPPYLFLR